MDPITTAIVAAIAAVSSIAIKDSYSSEGHNFIVHHKTVLFAIGYFPVPQRKYG
ncbi:MAG: hypothetical protein ACFB2X_10440 [Rivularia sp. (in: cyanobacteria)]